MVKKSRRSKHTRRARTTRKQRKNRNTRKNRNRNHNRKGGGLYCPPGQLPANQESHGGFCVPWDSTYSFMTGRPYL